ARSRRRPHRDRSGRRPASGAAGAVRAAAVVSGKAAVAAAAADSRPGGLWVRSHALIATIYMARQGDGCMSKRVVVVGAGIVGLWTAYEIGRASCRERARYIVIARSSQY